MSVLKSRTVADNSPLEDLIHGQFLLCRYETDLWIGNVKELSFENEGVLVRFMHPKVPSRIFHWPIREDVCWVPTEHILGKIQPLRISKTGRVYQLAPSDEKLLK